jgi:hypothetical protein
LGVTRPFLSLGLLAALACGGESVDKPVQADAALVSVDASLPEFDAAPAEELVLLGRYPMSLAADLDVTSDGNLAVITSWFDGEVHVVDTTDKANPSRLALISDLGYSPDVQLNGRTLYVSHENVGVAFFGKGVTIYDLSEAETPKRVGALDESNGALGLEGCHNLWPQVERDLLYCASTASGRVVILTTASPGSLQQPALVTTLAPPEGAGVHDMYALGDRLYVAWLDAGLAVYDIADPSSPTPLGRGEYAEALTHTVWPSADGSVAYTTDEVEGGHLSVWDISNVAEPQQIGAYQPNPQAIIHNAEVVGDRIYISHYTEGLKVLDATDPRNPFEIGGHDFFDGPDQTGGDPFSGLQGAWGVEAVPPYVFVSGTGSGLWIYEMR